jgi:ATP-binding cassette subfamily B protein
MNYLGKYFKKYGFTFSCTLFILAGEAACDLSLPTLMAHVIDNGIAKRDLRTVFALCGWMLFLTAAGACAASLRNIFSNNISQRFGRDVRSDLYRKIMNFSFGSLDRFDTGTLITRTTNDVTQLQTFFNGIMRIFVKAPLLIIGSLVMALSVNPGMAVVPAVVIPVVVFIIFLNLRWAYPLFRNVQAALDRVNGTMREFLSGIRVVKAFNRSDYEQTRFSEANSELSGAFIRVMKVMAGFIPSVLLAVNLGILAVLWYGGYRVDLGQMKTGQILAFVNYMTQILFSLIMLSFIFNMLVRARASAERIGAIFNTEDRMVYSMHPILPGRKNFRIEFDKVSFSYFAGEGQRAREPVLDNISFVCGAGDNIGIIGATGSGKSTLVGLIPRFYDPSSGSIFANGINIRNVDIRSLREKIAIVPQKSVLFTGTIMENILWGNPAASEEDVIEASRIAQAHGFISGFPGGYSSVIGRGGVNLSGGQKQRIAIARALVRKPGILIMDDSTSSLDAGTETRLQEALFNSDAGGLTCFIISQRISSVLESDSILLLDGGRLEGFGSHAELLKSSVLYRELFHSQIGSEVPEDA